jgi:Lrp/AsnC family transcriptional regulator for asnA, asnC and gidA
MTIDIKKREQVIDLLLDDSRLSLREIATQLDISPTSAGKLIKELEDDGVILGHTVMVDWQKLGYDSVMCLQVAASAGADVEKVGSVLKEIPNVKQVFYTMGEMTFACYAVCQNNTDAADLMKKIGKIEGVDRLICHTVLRTF